MLFRSRRYREVLDRDRLVAVDRYFRANEPRHAALLHATVSPTVISGGQSFNVIPSEAKATLDVRMLPDDDPAAVLSAMTRVVADPAVTVRWAPRTLRPVASSALSTDAFRAVEAQVKKHYGVTTLPSLGTGATDMAYIDRKSTRLNSSH